MTSIFDPADFEAARRKALEDQRLIVPEGEYLAVIDDLRFRRAGEPNRWIVDVLWDILDSRLRESLRLAKVIVPQPVPLDLDERGLLADDPGLNTGIRKIREALGQEDVPGRP